MNQLIAVGGEPATGKTTLMRTILPYLGEGSPFKFGLVRGYQFNDTKTFVLGIYDDDVFAGTDRLSMAVSIDSKAFVEAITSDEKWFGWTIMFEGDRLFTKSFLGFCKGKFTESKFAVITSTQDEKDGRHRLRQDTQTESWLRGRKTKVDNILLAFSCRVLPNDNLGDCARNAESIYRWIERFCNQARAN